MTKIPSREEVQQTIAEQEAKIRAYHQEFSKEPSLAQFSIGGIFDGVGCIACKVGLNAEIGGVIAAAVALAATAGVVITISALAETGPVIAIAAACGTEATYVALLIIGAVGAGAAGAADAVEEIIGKLCISLGACS